MFDVGFTEILLIGVVSLVIIGPERLPDVARTAGQWIGKLQRFVRGVKSDISRELDSGELKQLIGDQREQIDELRKMVRSTARDIESTTHDAVRGARRKLDEMEEAVDEVDAEVEADADVTPPAKRIAPPAGSRSSSGSDSGDVASTDDPVSASPDTAANEVDMKSAIASSRRNDASTVSAVEGTSDAVPADTPVSDRSPPSLDKRADPDVGETVRSGTGTRGA